MCKAHECSTGQVDNDKKLLVVAMPPNMSQSSFWFVPNHGLSIHANDLVTAFALGPANHWLLQ